jgi:hypothetical protein
LTTSCMGTPLMSGGNGGSGGSVSNGVLGLAREASLLIVYCVKPPPAGAEPRSVEPTALMGPPAENGSMSSWPKPRLGIAESMGSIVSVSWV